MARSSPQIMAANEQTSSGGDISSFDSLVTPPWPSRRRCRSCDPGPARPRLSDNLGAFDLRLGVDEIDRLTSVSAPGLPDYPYGMLKRYAEMTHWKIPGTTGR